MRQQPERWVKRTALPFTLLAGFVLVSCGCEPPGNKALNSTERKVEDKTRLKATARREESDDGDHRMTPTRRTGQSEYELTELQQAGGRASERAAEMAWQAIEESRGYGDTLVVWMFDASPSASKLVSEVRDYAANQYLKNKNDSEHALKTAVGQYVDQVTWHLEEASEDSATVVDALQAVSPEQGENEATFAAIETCLDKFKTLRLRLGLKTTFILVTDEAGNDWERVDDLVGKFSRYQIPVYVIGVPAPFGHRYIGDTTEQQYGPESRGFESVKMANWGGDVAADVVDSGFGPFGLEWLSRASGGVFLAVRPETSRFVGAVGSSWPSGTSMRFPKDVMERYAPDYVDAQSYDQLINGNQAIAALVQASKVGHQDMMSYPQLQFGNENEAALARALTEAQKSAARLGPQVNRIYDTLKEGQRARDDIQSPRWQAAYDLAFGRAAAAKVRVDGYNSMLAALKRGMTFENPGSTMWVLQADDSISIATSLQNISDRAREHLQRVIDEHPNTPWAMMAERELQTPIGWKWTEK